MPLPGLDESLGELLRFGSVFSEQDTHFRLSYATDDETIRRGCAILRELT